MKLTKKITSLIAVSFLSLSIVGQNNIDKKELSALIDKEVKKEISVGPIKVDSIAYKEDVAEIYCNYNLAYYPFRPNSVNNFNKLVKSFLSKQGYSSKQIAIYASGENIENLIPNIYRKKRNRDLAFTNIVSAPLVLNKSLLFEANKGLKNKYIALWQSHGYYFEPKLDRWEWQRARIFQTVEDLYTQSYVLPFLVPMLESAGATLILPRERDTQIHEIIIDNDTKNSSLYTETNGDKDWSTGELTGFAHKKEFYTDYENPFKDGTYREIETVKRGEESTIQWTPNIPKDGKYAVYVSYKSLPKSTSNARYTVFHKGGSTEFHVNQKMGGSTWIYLGHFEFNKGISNQNKVILSNISNKKGEILTADAIKIGGGYGNIARKVSENGVMNNSKSSESLNQVVSEQDTSFSEYQISTYPRFTEAARYWMQWAGIPDSIYSPSQGLNDYTDDYRSRGMWVNYIAGGSSANPNEEGLNIPIDLAFAFHSDAGTTFNDSIIGTLGIYYTKSHEGKLANGASKELSRDLTDLIQTQIVDDIRALYNPQWTRRGMWDKAYSEAAIPKVPTMLLELLSHQNFADMQYGLDPRFRFTVSRAIYKGILRYLSSQYNTEYTIQPLPINSFNIGSQEGKAILTWEATPDTLEASAIPTAYIVYSKIGNQAFDQGKLIKKNQYEVTIPKGVVCSFKVTAINDGGESFPSETLAIGESIHSKGKILIVNGFTRVSAPDDFDAQPDSIAGFLDESDHGVPYISDISYIGKMKEFRRTVPWMDDDASGFGDSYGNFETQVIAGNTFDYTTLHGEAILNAGFSFTSTSKQALEKGLLNTSKYDVIDLILGKEKQTKFGPISMNQITYKTFSKKMQQVISEYCNNGGSILASGAYIATDIWDNPLVNKQEEDIDFATNILGYKWRVNQAAVMGGVKEVNSPIGKANSKYQYYNTLNNESYIVESPDAIEPANAKGYTTMRYTENNLSAAVAYKADNYKTYIMGIPFEAIKTSKSRDSLMKKILTFLTKESN